jgi:hypothetical protein
VRLNQNKINQNKTAVFTSEVTNLQVLISTDALTSACIL